MPAANRQDFIANAPSIATTQRPPGSWSEGSAMPLSPASHAILAAAALLILPSTTAADNAPATVAEDAALAEQIFERNRKAGEIASWAVKRAEQAIRNSPTFVARQAESNRGLAECRQKASEAELRFRKHEMEMCDLEAGGSSDSFPVEAYEDELRELSRIFIRERLEEERGRMEKSQFDALRRKLGVADGSII